MRFLSVLAADLRFALRMMRQNAALTSVAIVCLALGIGASSAMSSLIYALWVDPYPYRDSNRMLNFSFVNQEGRNGTMGYSLADYLELQRSATTLEEIAARDGMNAVVTSGLPESVRVVLFTPNAFDHFGVPAMIGRTWAPKDIPQPGAPPPVAVLSYLFWTRHFNSDRGIAGRTIELNRQPYTILGVVPPRFTWNDADVYLPMSVTPDPKRFVALMTHVREGVSLDAVNAELQAITQRFAARDPHNYPKAGFRMRVQTLNDFLLQRFGGTLKVLAAAVGLLLLIGCANVSILLLARATARQREMAIRVSMGAPAHRILRQLLTESVVLAFAGGLLGMLLAYRSVPAIVALMPQYSVPHEADIRVNAQVVLLTFAVSVLTGILFGMAPALQMARADVAQAMQSGSRGSSEGGRGGKIRSGLIVAEVALTMILLAGASVSIRSFLALERVPLGYQPENVLAMNINLPQGRYTTWTARSGFFERMASEFRLIPGVRTATFTETALPPYIGFNTDFEIAGRTKMERQQLRVGLIGPQYFETAGIPVLQGRLLTEAEIVHNAHLGVINEELSRRYFRSGPGPLGARIHVPGLKLSEPEIFIPPEGDQWFEVVGVAATARNRGLQEAPEPAIYVPYKMATAPGATFLLKTEVDPLSIVRAARERVRSVADDLPLTEIRTLEEYLSRFERAYPRFSMTLFSIFAAVALLLAATGLYSVVSYTVAQRTHEFGIRMALGAQRGHVLRLVAGSTVGLIAAGAAIGLAGSMALSRVISRFLEGWNPRDPVAYIAVAAVLLVTGLLACWFPARRATAIDPMAALGRD
ncbi:MAG TPA: ABC transporter permease [Candidatus Acidoferrales bacterium]|nr:ABC transporter permease [Candidatus Acidoferrales bacterium]